MAIVHCVLKASSTAPKAVDHLHYISCPGKRRRRGTLEHVESGNLPDFAGGDASHFWKAADLYERVNGRVYTRIEFALPRELTAHQRFALARRTAGDFFRDEYAYTIAVQMLTAQDGGEQPYLQMMLCERVVDSTTRSLEAAQFFKRNGAKKSREWNGRGRPFEVRTRWCRLLNEALDDAGLPYCVDPRSWADQGREDLAQLREEKLTRGFGPRQLEKRINIRKLRERRSECPPVGLDLAAAIRHIEETAALEIARIEQRCAEKLVALDMGYSASDF